MRRRSALSTLAILTLLTASANLHTRAYATATEVKNLPYGAALFDFYQDKYFSALTHIGAAQTQNRLGPHAQEAELVAGGMYLSYGMHRRATEIFERLIAQGAPASVRDRAWFYLAKINYQRGYSEQATAALARIGEALPAEFKDERRLLQAYLLMEQGDAVAAIAALEAVDPASTWAAYGRFNLGVALVKAGRMDDGVRILGEVGTTPMHDDEFKSLKDKANVALGYAFLQRQEPERAKAYLEHVRLDSPLANKALLGMGWAQSALNQHRQALVPWRELQTRDIIDSAIQESLLAVPYAYGKLGAFKKSLERYQFAIAAYEAEQSRLRTAVTAIAKGKLNEQLLAADSDDEMGWFWQMRAMPSATESRYLTTLLATHAFQEALKNYRDARFLERNLAHWQGNIAAFDDMVATRRRAYSEKFPRVQGASRALDVDGFRAQRDRFAAELARIERDRDPAALATEQEQAQALRLRTADARVARLTRDGSLGADAPMYREKLRLLHGVLAWQLHDAFPERAWHARRDMRDLDAGLTEATARRADLQRALVAAPAAFADFETRIRSARARLHTLHTQAQALTQAQAQFVQRLAIAELERQHERLDVYLMQARFAVAQIYDQAGTPPTIAPESAPQSAPAAPAP